MLGEVHSVEYLDRGHSTDSKYVLWEGHYPKYMLRLSDVEMRERRNEDFKILKRHFERGVRCPEPHLFGVTQDGKACYMLLGYLQGENAEEALPSLPEAKQYEIGLDAGRELQRLHEVCHSDPDFEWPRRREAEHRGCVEDARAHGLTFGGQDRMETYVEANLGLLRDAPARSLHGDYHVGNVIVREERFIGVIDFTNLYWGDPVEDFYKTSWLSAPLSVPFACGVVHGYLAGTVPQNFWRRYNLYLAMGLPSSLVWGLRYYPARLWRFHERIRHILQTHDFEGGRPPSWYQEKGTTQDSWTEGVNPTGQNNE